MKIDQGRRSNDRFFGWRMVALACLCTNVSAGLTFGAYGTFMPAMIREFAASRSLASAGLSIMLASMGLLAPVAGYAVRRWSIRATLTLGFVLLSLSWGLMSIATNAWQFVLAFGLLCGPAAACLVIVPPMTLVNNWFIAQRGRAVGIVIVPILLMVVPPLAAAGITAHGWRATGLALALSALLMAPLMRFVIDRPENVGQIPLGAGGQGDGDASADGDVPGGLPQGSATREPVFWVLMLCAGLLSGSAVAFAGHLIAFTLGLGLTLRNAAYLLSVYAAAGLAGSFLGGLLADRIGGTWSFATIAFLQCIAWPCLLLHLGYGFLAFWIAVIGLCANALLPVCATLFANVFGRARFARVMGLFSLVTMPFNFILPLMAGGLYDYSGSYRSMFLICATLFAIAGVIACLVHRIEVSRQTASLLQPLSAVI